MDTSPLLITIVSGAVSIISILIARWFDRRSTAAGVRETDAKADALTKKTDAEAKDLLTQAAERLMTRYEKQIEVLDKKLTDTQKHVAELEARLTSADEALRRVESGIAVLTKQVKRLGEIPDWP